MQELLVIIACLNAKGCDKASSAYYQTNPNVREMIERQERRIKNYVGPVVVEAATPVFFILRSGTGSFKLYKNLSLEIKDFKEGKLVYSVGF